MTLVPRAVVTAAIGQGFKGVTLALSLVAVPLYLQWLGAKGYGLLLSAMAFAGYVSLGDMGLNWGLLILVSHAAGSGKREAVTSIWRHGLLLSLAASTVVVAVTAALGWGVSSLDVTTIEVLRLPEVGNLVVLAGVQVAVALLSGTVYALLAGLNDTHLVAMYGGTAQVLGQAAGLLCAWATRSPTWVLVATILASTGTASAGTLHTFLRHRWAFQGRPPLNRDQLALQIRTGMKAYGVQIGKTLTNHTPTLAISTMIGPAYVPLFTVPFTLLYAAFGPVWSYAAALQPRLGAAWVRGDGRWIAGTVRGVLEKMVLVACLGVGVYLPLAAEFIRLWTNGRLQVGLAMVTGIVAFCAIEGVLAPVEFALVAMNAHRTLAIAEIGRGVLALVTAFAVARLGSADWVPFAAVGASLVTAVWAGYHSLSTRLGSARFYPPLMFWCKAMVLGLSVGALVLMSWHAAQPVAAWQRWLTLFAAAGAALVAFGAGAEKLGLVRLREVVQPLMRAVGWVNAKSPSEAT